VLEVEPGVHDTPIALLERMLDSILVVSEMMRHGSILGVYQSDEEGTDG
jgi:hypothetical protein